MKSSRTIDRIRLGPSFRVDSDLQVTGTTTYINAESDSPGELRKTKTEVKMPKNYTT